LKRKIEFGSNEKSLKSPAGDDHRPLNMMMMISLPDLHLDPGRQVLARKLVPIFGFEKNF
jgi:hypothetical protein